MVLTRRVAAARFLFALALMGAAVADAEARPGGGRGRGGRGGAASGGRVSPGGFSGASPRATGGLTAQGPGGRLPGAATGGGTARPNAQQLQGYLNRSAAQGHAGQLQGQLQGQLSTRGGEFRAGAQSWVTDFQNGPQPFSAAWYADHPQAWQYAHPHADAWAVATVAATSAWLGYATVDGSGATAASTTVYVEGSVGEPTLAAGYADPSVAAAAPVVAGDWLPLGVFALDRPHAPGRQLVQLAVDRNGTIEGAYYDEFLGATVNVIGSVDRATQRVSWSPESNPQTVFSVSLADLAAPEMTLNVVGPAGAEVWRAVRLEDPAP